VISVTPFSLTWNQLGVLLRVLADDEALGDATPRSTTTFFSRAWRG
jgi:hypothetical protein